MTDNEGYTEFTTEAIKLAQDIGDLCDTYQKGAILEAMSIILADVIGDLEMEHAIPMLLEVLQDAILMAYDIDTSVVSAGKMQ